MKDPRPITIFCDIDGTLIKHKGIATTQSTSDPIVLPGVLEKLREWDTQGYNIILTTGRKEGSRRATEEQLEKAGIIYDQLVMGIGGGPRVLINDTKPPEEGDELTARAIIVERNTGLKDIDV